MDINRAASIEILANLLIDVDAYTKALTARTSTVDSYKAICDRIADLAEMTGAKFGDVLDDMVRIKAELHVDQANR